MEEYILILKVYQNVRDAEALEPLLEPFSLELKAHCEFIGSQPLNPQKREESENHKKLLENYKNAF